MKFAQIALALVAATVALGDAVSLSGDCKKEFQKYAECGDTKAAKYDDFVKIYESEKCQTYYKDPIAALKKCDDLDQDTKDKLIADVKFSQAYNILHTARDENGKSCPLYNSKHDIAKVKDTCGSAKCVSSSIEAYKLFAEGKKLNKNKETTIEKFNSILKELEACGGAAAAGAANAATDAANAAAGAAANATDAAAAAAGAAANATANAAGAAANATQTALNNTANNVANATNVEQANASGAESIKYTVALLVATLYLLL
ncbi:hypothetical protein BCR32DRAFT_327611 [Anaeromyces robustus]|jgi:hypothetical protein|uniref:Uncharacterized protein n=1 Tax=Anaeromyces robustus TaxID=1754192 RepID=A0A1Y1X5W7_9FUNG|nr:hypothetical protein BCR32DRAFT_327611 [Anaeromyces robustus]|eukprot:ORX80694.1 hypothetical protein BCR32DRAFT_327611 [Anaeromyces robustus]